MHIQTQSLPTRYGNHPLAHPLPCAESALTCNDGDVPDDYERSMVQDSSDMVQDSSNDNNISELCSLDDYYQNNNIFAFNDTKNNNDSTKSNSDNTKNNQGNTKNNNDDTKNNNDNNMLVDFHTCIVPIKSISFRSFDRIDRTETLPVEPISITIVSLNDPRRYSNNDTLIQRQNALTDSFRETATPFDQAKAQFRRNKEQPILICISREEEFIMPVHIMQLEVDTYLQHYTCQTEAQLNRLIRSCLVQYQRQTKPRLQLESFLYGFTRHQKFRSHLRQQKQRLRRIPSKRLLHSTTLSATTTTTIIATASHSKSIFRLPYEILSLIPPHVSNPRDLLNLSHTCKAFQELCDEQLWFNLHIQQVSHWSADAEFCHLGPGSQPWRQVVLDDYFRNLAPPNCDTLIESNRRSPANFHSNWKIELSRSDDIRPAHLGPAAAPSSLSGPHLLPDAQTKAAKPMWRNTGPPVSHTDPLTQFTITAYLQAQSTLDASTSEQTVYQVVLYNLHDHNTPLAIIPGSLWSDSNRTNLQRPANPRPLIGQLMDIRRYAHQKDILGRTRILFAMAFGERVLANVTQPDRGPGEIEMELLDIWSQGKIVEVYIHDTPQAAVLPLSKSEQRPAAPYWGRVQHIDPSPQHPTLIRGRAIKLYSIQEEFGQEQDRVALFGIHYDGHSNIVMLTGPVFPASVPSSSPYTDASGNASSSSLAVPTTIRHVTHRLHTPWSPCFFGSLEVSETTSMTLFPAHSEFEHLLVIIDRRGQGEIWDWVNNQKVASLTVAKDSRMEAHPAMRQNLYFWGVQVNWTVEEPTRTMSSGQGKKSDVAGSEERSLVRKHGDFRIIALADGNESEWETIRWDIKGTDLKLQQKGDASKIGWTVKSRGRHYERCTLGESHISPSVKSVDATTTTIPTPATHPLLFVAFLIWDHYRIALTSKFGLCLFDMNKEMPEDVMTLDESHPPMWVTELENSAQNPLLDIATAGDYLILTRRYSHVLWPFRKVVST